MGPGHQGRGDRVGIAGALGATDARAFPPLDFGPLYIPQDESGIATQLPPYPIGKDDAILVPQVGASTGNIKMIDDATTAAVLP